MLKRAVVLLLMATGCAKATTVVGRLGGLDGNVRVAATGTTIYAAALESLAIIDASDPAKPRLANRLQFPGRLGGVATDGRLAYVTVTYFAEHRETPLYRTWQKNGWIAVREYFRSNVVAVDPATLRVTGVIAIDAPAFSAIHSAGGRLYVAGSGSGLWVIDAPKLANATNIDITALETASAGNLIAVAAAPP
jgi:hypothetical protein